MMNNMSKCQKLCKKMGIVVLTILLISFVFTASARDTFTNPIIPPSSADPFVVQYSGHYYHIHRIGSQNAPGIAIRKTTDLTELDKAKPVWVWAAPEEGPYSREIWAPELHFYKGKWYIYVAADDGKNENHRMWAIESEGSDPMGPYNQTPYFLETGGWAIDGTFFTDSENNPYFVWSGWPGKVDGTQYLYIAPMDSPTKISKERTRLSIPTEDWEKHEMPLLEGPEILRHEDKLFIIYSASGSWSKYYCLGMLEYTGGSLCDPASWKKHTKAPVFEGKDKVFGVGHCSFVTSPDQTENWIVYHTKSKEENGWGDRCVHTIQFTYDEQGIPVFGTPVQPGTELEKPSGVYTKKISVRDNYSDTWVATDNLGRSLPDEQTVGKPKENRSIGMFYFLWMGAHGRKGPFDVTKILAEYPEAINDEKHPAWGPMYAPHHWGESWFGYYISSDEAVLEKHARMLADMDVDVIIFDVSNQYTYYDHYMALCRAFTRVRENGGKTPQIAFLCPFGIPANTVKKLWEEFYSKGLYSDLWYQWKGKPLIMADINLCSFGEVWGKRDGALELKQGETMGESFHVEKPIIQVAASIPTWNTTNSAVTLTLRKLTPEGEVITKQRFDSVADNGWLRLSLEQPLPKGDYYLEISDPKGKIGWWAETGNNVPGGKAWKNGKETSGTYSIQVVYEDDPFAMVSNFFTFRKPQPEYFPGPSGPNQWGWLEVYPQHIFYDAQGEPEQMTVGVAQNAVDGKLSVLSNPRSHGRSFHNGAQPGPEGQDTTGRNFQEQWNRVFEVNPPFVFITGWNEWIMGRFDKNAPFYGSGPVTFVDQFNAEYSRDIEPGLCPHSDNYYYQAISNIRRYKGVRELEKVVSSEIVLDGSFEDWREVSPEFIDDIGDPVHRNHEGWQEGVVYKNMTGRNDIICAKMSLTGNNLATYVHTFEPMRRPKQNHWMLLFLDVDGNHQNGWLGYDFILRTDSSDPLTTAVIQKHTGETGEYHWETVGKANRIINGTQMETLIPLDILGLKKDSVVSIDFKWADNIQETGETRDLTINGDCAPNDRYNYRAIFSKNP